MKTIDVPQSGKCGEIIASTNHYGPYVRRRARPAKRRTKRPSAAQRVTRDDVRAVTEAREALTDEQLRAWIAAAKHVRSKPRLGKSWPLTWQVYFARVNNPRSAFGLPLLMDPPEGPEFSRSPVGGLSITNRGGRIELKLEVAGTPSAHIMVFGAKACSRFVFKCFKCPRLGPLPAAAGGMSDITGLYLKKHGKPAVGQRVFIRTRQYLDGGHDEFLETAATVPPSEARGGPAEAV